MNSHHTVLDLAHVAVPLAGGAHCVVATLGCAGFVNAADCLGVRMILGHDLLASISQLVFIPFDRFEESL
jgi:hypothetical protein